MQCKFQRYIAFLILYVVYSSPVVNALEPVKGYGSKAEAMAFAQSRVDDFILQQEYEEQLRYKKIHILNKAAACIKQVNSLDAINVCKLEEKYDISTLDVWIKDQKKLYKLK